MAAPNHQTDEVGEQFEELASEAQQQADVPITDITRDFIARTVIRVFFLLLGIILVGTPIYNANVASDLRLNLPDMLQQYSSILGPVLGFVIGYYFKAKE